VERGSFRRESGRGQALKMNWEVGRVKLQEKTEKCVRSTPTPLYYFYDDNIKLAFYI
jgi:hypothetical protein